VPLSGAHHRHAGFLESAAGLLDNATPEARIHAEAEEETGYRVRNVRKVFEAFMSPGSVTERLHFYVGEYDDSLRVSDGGGVKAEGEDLEVIELPLRTALEWIEQGTIADGKTIMLLQYAAPGAIVGHVAVSPVVISSGATRCLVLPGVPPEYFQALLLQGTVPDGIVSYHEAFESGPDGATEHQAG
jgi:8-oxo-dGTP pyrophosphatase MutT (NUDIX family)